MLDKHLRRWCATEVQILIGKIEDGFDDVRGNPVWLKLTADLQNMTWVERYCVRRTLVRAHRTHARKKFLAAIIKQQLDPQKKDDFEDAVRSGLMAGVNQQFNAQYQQGKAAAGVVGAMQQNQLAALQQNHLMAMNQAASQYASQYNQGVLK